MYAALIAYSFLPLRCYHSGMEKRTRGRPRLENGKKERLPSIRVTKEQLKAYQAAAKAAGVGIGEWVRRALDRASKQN